MLDKFCRYVNRIGMALVAIILVLALLGAIVLAFYPAFADALSPNAPIKYHNNTLLDPSPAPSCYTVTATVCSDMYAGDID